MKRPTKTFQLATPMDVFMKLEFDLKRLRASRSTKDLQFAAIDLAVWGFHMIDWVLASISAEHHVNMTGKQPRASGAIGGFMEAQASRLKTLGFCQQIANTSKHRILTHTKDNASFSTHHTIRFVPPLSVTDGKYSGRIFAEAFLRDTDTGEELEAGVFFNGMVEQWRGFLKAERLYDWNYDYEPPEPDDEEAKE